MDTIERYAKGKQAGFDSHTNRWRDIHGRFTTREAVLREEEGFSPFGGYIAVASSKDVQLAEQLERIVGGIEPSQIQAAAYGFEPGYEKTEPMPSEILAMMQLSEYFCRTEGDVWQTIEAPLQLGLRNLIITSKDQDVEDEFKEIYDESRLDIQEILYGIWICLFMYGSAYPIEVYDGNVPVGVFLLNPKKMEVGRSTSLGRYSVDMQVTKDWVAQISQTIKPALFFNSLGSDYNEMAQEGHVPLSPEYCTPVRYMAAPFKRYPIPPVARASRSISLRQIHEEYVRAALEGHRSQLWVFTIGSPEQPAGPAKVQYLQQILSGHSGDRTGMLVWTHDLQVDIYSPNALDQMLGDQAWRMLTADIYRKLGVSLRVVSGEAPMGATRTGEELDVKILLGRLRWVRERCLRWARGFNYRYAKRQNKAAMLKALPSIKFQETFLEIEQVVKGYVQPMMMMGKMSTRTALEQVGLDYDEELERKQSEAPDKIQWLPDPIYAQYTAAGGTIAYSPQGRPPEGQEVQKPIKIAAADIAAYERAILAAYDEILTADVGDRPAAINDFVDRVKALNMEHISDAYVEGYNIAGGTAEISAERVEEAIRWNNDFLDNFGEDLRANVDDDAQLQTWRNRAMLYAPEGHKKGFMMGIFEVMLERGAQGWRRILHPERSRTGPCEICIADSRLIHPITVEFWEPHPHGVCTQQSVYFYRQYGVVEIPIGFPFTEFPVPFDERIVRRVR